MVDFRGIKRLKHYKRIAKAVGTQSIGALSNYEHIVLLRQVSFLEVGRHVVLSEGSYSIVLNCKCHFRTDEGNDVGGIDEVAILQRLFVRYVLDVDLVFQMD